jgi:hypothetical protein
MTQNKMVQRDIGSCQEERENWRELEKGRLRNTR